MDDDIFLPFLRYIAHAEIVTASPIIAIARYDAGLGSYVDIKTLQTSCNRSDIAGGVRVTCTASDTSGDTYNADAVILRRSQYTIDGVPQSEIARYLVSINKQSTQRVDIQVIIDLASSRIYT